MSGGMNQRIISALGLVCDPKWIIADEPTKGLDPLMRNQVYKVLKKIYQENHCGMLIITHDLMFAKNLCHEIRVTYSGEMIEQGECCQVFANPLHPYTVALLDALPQNGMKPIPNKVENQIKGNSTCKFFNRCTEASEKCLNRKMEDFPVGENRLVRCFKYA